jgi:ribosome-associated protein
MERFKIKEEIILLNQLLKVLGWCETGGHANTAIEAGDVMVNGKTELRKRNKLKYGDIIKYGSHNVILE